jgi:hypothetical protein
MNTFIFFLAVLLTVAWWISGEVHRLKANKQEQLDDELASKNYGSVRRVTYTPMVRTN